MREAGRPLPPRWPQPCGGPTWAARWAGPLGRSSRRSASGPSGEARSRRWDLLPERPERHRRPPWGTRASPCGHPAGGSAWRLGRASLRFGSGAHTSAAGRHAALAALPAPRFVSRGLTNTACSLAISVRVYVSHRCDFPHTCVWTPFAVANIVTVSVFTLCAPTILYLHSQCCVTFAAISETFHRLQLRFSAHGANLPAEPRLRSLRGARCRKPPAA